MLTDGPCLSRQIRPPIYSMKQSRLRRKRVIRYSLLYFLLLAVMVGLIVGPIVAGPMLPKDIGNTVNGFGFALFQPNKQDNDDTLGTKQTGTGMPGYSGAGLTMTTATATSR